MQKLSIQEMDLKNQRVFLRVDFNVPLNKEGQITDDTRIRAVIPTIEYIAAQGGKVIIGSHMGRPEGRDPKLSLAPCAKRLSELLRQPVAFAPDCIGPEVKTMVNRMQEGDILLLENLRFISAECHPQEDPSFATKLADFADMYVDDAFACSHRNHTSIVSLPKKFPDCSAAGFLLEREVTFLSTVVQHAKPPFYAICGGAKIHSKIGVIQALIDKVDAFFIGGGMVFTFLKAAGIEIGDSICDNEQISIAKDILHVCKTREIALHLPEDLIVVKQLDTPSTQEIIETKNGIPAGFKGVDIGPKTLEKWSAHFKEASTIFWNGPMGIFEIPEYANGTEKLAETLSNLTCITIVGGGDSVAAVNQAHLKEKFTHISTGGGASLEFIEHGTLPGIEVLTNS